MLLRSIVTRRCFRLLSMLSPLRRFVDYPKPDATEFEKILDKEELDKRLKSGKWVPAREFKEENHPLIAEYRKHNPDTEFTVPGYTDGNIVHMYVRGNDYFSDMLNAAIQAKYRVWIEAYIVEADIIGQLLLNTLESCANRGVSVILIYDSVGSGISSSHTKNLIEAGGIALPFRSLNVDFPDREPNWVRKFFYRTHRKIIAIDDVTFSGGMNISQKHCNIRDTPSQYEDVHFRYEGPAAIELSATIVETYSFLKGSTKEMLREISMLHLFFVRSYNCRYVAQEDMDSKYRGTFVQILESNTRKRRQHIQMTLEEVVDDAVDTILLTTPYFFPPPRLEKAFFRAASRGVKVTLLIAGKTDVIGMRPATSYILGEYMKQGIDVYEMRHKELHQKTIIVDNSYIGVGSYNMDYISYKFNMEISVSIHDERLCKILHNDFWRKVSISHPVTSEFIASISYFTRMQQYLAYSFACWLWKGY